ncbi:MAG: HNH endonuclease [Myxococcales bacterium]|nr:HNH endonuclease [Myxococcales bacterium]
MRERFAAGALVYTVVRELCRVVTPETEEVWLAAVEGQTCTAVQRMVAGREEGALPTDPVDEDLVPKRVTLTLSVDAFALLEAARSKAIRDAGHHVDDSAFIREAMLTYLCGGTERDAGKSAFQIALTVDARDRARMRGGAEAVPVDEATLERARCDAQHIGVVDEGDAARASQTIPPKVRRQVVARHEGRCAVPGCRHAAFGEVHHVVPRADGGTHDPDVLVLLCSSHHAAAHDGALVVRGTWSRGFAFRHADGRPYGAPPTDSAPVALMRDAFSALRQLGFRETETRTMLDRVRAELPEGPTLESVVKLALARAPVSCVREEVVGYRRLAA